jgi:hypothetical protein
MALARANQSAVMGRFGGVGLLRVRITVPLLRSLRRSSAFLRNGAHAALLASKQWHDRRGGALKKSNASNPFFPVAGRGRLVAWQDHHEQTKRGPEKVSGTVILFLRSAVRAERTLQTKLLDHLLGPRRVAIGTATLNAATEGSQLGVRLRGVHMIDPTWATGKWPSG